MLIYWGYLYPIFYRVYLLGLFIPYWHYAYILGLFIPYFLSCLLARVIYTLLA